MTADLVGTWSLTRLALRRDRWLLPTWIIVFAGMAGFSATATQDLYTSEESLVSAADTINATAALVALYGRIYDPTSIGAVSLIKMTAFGAALVAILMVFIVVRHTRSEEEAGRLELVGAGVVGRAAPLAAALIVGIGSSLVMGLVTALWLMTTSLPAAGCLAFGMSWALTGIVFAAIAAVTAQVTTGARAAIGLGMVAVGIAYVLRAVGDLAEQGPGWASWLSPIGWSQQIRPFAGDRWWVVVVPLAVTALLIPVAFALRARRDLDSGLIPDRPGPAHGRLGTLLGLAWRLQRGAVAAWFAGVMLMSFIMGSVANNVTGLLDSPEMKEFFLLLGGEKGLVDAFIAAELTILGGLVSAFAVASVSRMRSEEVPGHTELVLATATTRIRWGWSHYLVATVGVAALIAAMGASIGLGHGLAVGDLGQVGRITGAALVHVPAAWVMAAIVMVLFGWLPRWVAAAWGILVAFILLGEFGQLWKLPQWLLDLSPFAHIPRLPGAQIVAADLIGLVLVAAALTVVGFVGWRRRDLAA